ncbi:MAG: hypothetical protein GY749_47690, partial [Desulfobacteraceae bacterium]|nr:hypothetical protein [Desulfobacteraceae bacterium]
MKKLFIICFCFMFQFAVVSSSHAGLFDDIIDWVDGAANDTADWFQGAGEDTLDWFENAGEDAIGWFENAGDDVTEWFKTAGGQTESFLDFVDEATSCTGYQSSGSISFNRPGYTAETTGQFSVLTYNVHGFPEFIGGITEAEMRSISEFIESWDVDIAGIQEDWVTHEELISNLTTGTYPYRTDHFCGTPTSFGDGLLTISGFAFDPNASVRYQFNKCFGTLMEYINGETNSPDCETEKGFSMTRIYIAKDLVVDFYNLHSNTGGHDNVNGPNMEQVGIYMEENSYGNAIVLVGDFNMGSTDTVMTDFAANYGFTFVCEEVGESCGIDMVLYRGTDRCSLSAVSQVKLDDGNISDHDPRKAVLQWQLDTSIPYWSASPVISLLGAHGEYVVAEGNGGGDVNANRSAIGSWEKFTLVNSDSYAECIRNNDSVRIRTGNGYYFSAQTNGDLDAD